MAMTRSDVIALLRKRQGDRSLRTMAAEIGCSPAYLSDVYHGKRNPGPLLLGALGLECRRAVEVEYVERPASGERSHDRVVETLSWARGDQGRDRERPGGGDR